MIFQMLIAGVLAAGFTLKMFWGRVKHLFQRRAAKDAQADD